MAKESADTKVVEEQLVPYQVYGESLHYLNWVEMTASARGADKKERDKLKKFEKRLIAVCTYRVFVFKKATFGGSRTLHKMIHLYDFVKLSSSGSDNTVELLYNEREKNTTATMRIKSDNIPALLSILAEKVQAMTYGFTEDAMLSFSGLTVQPSGNEAVPGIAGGFLEIYNAQCSYFRTRPSPEFKRYIQYLVANGITDLDLSNCPGVDAKTDISIDIPTIFESLKCNTYFRAIILRNVQLKNVTDSLGHCLRYNTSIARVQIVNTQEDQNLVSIGTALKANPGNVLQVLDLSHNSFSMESITSLCAGISSLTHALPVVNLSHCGISSKGIVALIVAFEANFGVSLSIQELDLSYNKFDETAAATFAIWLGHIKGVYGLRKLGLAGTNVDLVTLGPLLRTFVDLRVLDLSNNKMEKPEVVNELKTFIECSSDLHALDISGCNLSPEHLEEVLTQLSKNKKLNEFTLNISDNNLGVKGINVLARALADSSYLKSLNISHNKLKGKGIAEILVSLNTNQNIQELYIGKNAQGSTDVDDLIKPLVDFLSSHPNLTALDVSHSGAGKSLFPLIHHLATNTTLTSLDISDNQIGDLGASALSDALSLNQYLASLNLEQNGITLGGWQTLCYAFSTNRSLRQLNIPYAELEKLVPNDRKDQLRELITRITLYLQFNAGQPYPPGLPFTLPCTIPYDTPTGLTPLATIPAHLRNLPKSPSREESVLNVLNESTSPNFKAQPVSPASPDAEYKYIANSSRDVRSASQPPPPPARLVSQYSSPSTSPSTSPSIGSPSYGSPSLGSPSLAPPPPLTTPPRLPPTPASPSHTSPSLPSLPPLPPTPAGPGPALSLSPPARTNLFAPPPVLPSEPSSRNHSPSAPPPVVRATPSSAPPPPPAPPAAPAPPPPPPAQAAPAMTKDRAAVMTDITKFSKGGLRKTTTNDRSSPKV